VYHARELSLRVQAAGERFWFLRARKRPPAHHLLLSVWHDALSPTPSTTTLPNQPNPNQKPTTNSYKNYGLAALFRTSTDKVEVTSTVDNLAPGLKASVHATLPDSQSGAVGVRGRWGGGGFRAAFFGGGCCRCRN
jgi:hypothetical protein